MSPPIKLAKSAQGDFEQAYAYLHEHAGPGTATRFAGAVQSALKDIERLPKGYQIFQGKYRRRVIASFPYSVFYRIGTRAVVVVAIRHQAQEPPDLP